MQAEYTRKGDNEQPDFWMNHRNIMDLQRVITVQQMWEQLEPYVRVNAELT
jgi:hypothetical protein